MTLALLLSLVGIAVLDSLNPSLFVALVYLMTTPQPTLRSLSYIAGVLHVNFAGGILILSGARTLFNDWFTDISDSTLTLLQLVLGFALIGFGWWMKLDADMNPTRKPRTLSSFHTFILGMVVMLNELTTALPYFIAIERLAQAQLGTVDNLLALIIYNLIFAAPLLGFLGGFLLLRQRLLHSLEKMNHWLGYWMPRVIKYGAVVFGVGLVIEVLI